MSRKLLQSMLSATKIATASFTILLTLSTLLKLPETSAKCDCMPLYCNIFDYNSYRDRYSVYRRGSLICVEDYFGYLKKAALCLSNTNCHGYSFLLLKAILVPLLRIYLNAYSSIVVHSLLNLARYANNDFTITSIADVVLFVLVVVWILVELLESRPYSGRQPARKRNKQGQYA